MEYLQLLLGLALLIFSGRILINNAVAMARRLHIPSFVIGMTVVATGTSAPELLVSLNGALKGYSDVAVYNVVGSNISNVLLVLATAALILPIPVRRNTLLRDWTVMMILGVFLMIFVLDLHLSPLEGMILLLVLCTFVFFSVYRSKKIKAEDRSGESPPGSFLLALFLVLVSSAGLALGADMLVDGAVTLARGFGISERIISVSLVSVGTSIPELTASAVAAFRKETEISIGNVIGSNIFNVGFVLGITGMVRPLEVNSLILSFDIFWFLGTGILLLVLVLLPKYGMIQRWKGLTMLTVYLIYLYFVLGNVSL